MPTDWPAHPIDVEGQHGFDGGGAFGGGSLEDQDVARGVAAHHAGLGREIVEQLDGGGDIDVAQRHDADAKARLRTRRRRRGRNRRLPTSGSRR